LVKRSSDSSALLALARAHRHRREAHRLPLLVRVLQRSDERHLEVGVDEVEHVRRRPLRAHLQQFLGAGEGVDQLVIFVYQ
jgi:hypothetical protein